MNELNLIGLQQGLAMRTGSGGAALTQLLARLLDEIDYGMVLVGAGGALRFANQLGLQEVTAGSTLQLTQGLLRARQSCDQPRLQHALADAQRGKRSLFTLGHSGSVLSASVVPMAGEIDADDVLALLMFGKRPAGETLTLDFYARSHGLTGAETKVLKGICDGLQPKEIARRAAVAISTVRSHICSIRTKTQTASIRDLLSRVASLPPITPAMKARQVIAPPAAAPAPAPVMLRSFAARPALAAMAAC